uniref:Uncharacterized protein n=1 Tax=Arion vulgaris TaxID=1028688 RepID=A0A0B6Y775_9EUPU
MSKMICIFGPAIYKVDHDSTIIEMYISTSVYVINKCLPKINILHFSLVYIFIYSQITE